MTSSSIAEILKLFATTQAPTHILGATPSARAFFVARLIHAYFGGKNRNLPIIIVCADDDSALEFLSNLETLSTLTANEPLKVYHFPSWEHSPYSTVTPSIRTRLGRLTTLLALAENQPLDAIVTTLAASSQATLPKDLLARLTLRFKIKSVIESNTLLASTLTEMGYLRVDPVEDPGTFSIRGEILDIFPPQCSKPIRVEFFDNEIERIREFDPASQRTSSKATNLQALLIPPAREVLINSATETLLREKLKFHADNLGIPRSFRDPILASIRDGTYPDHSDIWAPFAYNHPSNLWTYLLSIFGAHEPLIVWNDELRICQNWNLFCSEQTLLSEEASRNGRLLPLFEELYINANSLINTVKAKSKLYLDGIQLYSLENSDKNTNSFDVLVETNLDAARSSTASISPDLEKKLKDWLNRKFRILIFVSTLTQLERIQYLLSERGIPSRVDTQNQSTGITLAQGSISEGFQWHSEGLIVLTEDEILNRSNSKKQKTRNYKKKEASSKEWSDIQALSDLVAGDLIVHREHGIGRYLGLVRLDLSGAPSDFIQLEYAEKDKLYLPIYRLNAVQKYIGVGGKANLDRLGSQHFLQEKNKVREATKKLAFSLIQLYAERKIQAGIKFSPPDAEYRQFEAEFPFEETPDQNKAINAVLEDLESGQMMDRLICGDVGYGKTEVAMRAAFRAVSEGKQVAVLVPTTILAIQHEQSFKLRMKNYPIIIESITRFKTQKEQKETVSAIVNGKIDILIGTHRLLSKDIKFQDLGLLIVDEEHRFGVEHKEILKTFKINTHVLTLTATPIPRTLHMSLAGLRDISLINTPPVDRLPIRTYVSKYDDSLVKKAIEFELARGGQVFFLQNRVQSINKTANHLKQLVPSANIIVAHGQMKENELEDAMNTFYQKKANVLVSTTIIESGLDLPAANTILITRADALGLAQLYQIRGRVGRAQQRGYAYLFIPDENLLSNDAIRRLEVIQRFVELGSGFSIASHDLEIRGGGDLLGQQQSGNIGAVGFDLYTELLDEAIHEIHNQPSQVEKNTKEPEIKTPFPAFLSEDYVPDIRQRLSLYRRFSACSEEEAIHSLEEELQDRFGNLPDEAQNLTWLIRIKLILKKHGIESLTVGREKLSLLSGKTSTLDPVRTISLITSYPTLYQLTPDSKLVAKVDLNTMKEIYFSLNKLVDDFSPRSTHS